MDTIIQVNQYLRASDVGFAAFTAPPGSHQVALWPISPTVQTWVVVAVTLTFVFVVMPAIWSRDPGRRAAALAVLDRILKAFRR